MVFYDFLRLFLLAAVLQNVLSDRASLQFSQFFQKFFKALLGFAQVVKLLKQVLVSKVIFLGRQWLITVFF